MRTIIYIDGLNLYYGSLKNTSYKWLDLHALCKNLLPKNYDIIEIKYFTARVKPRADNPDVHKRQNIYFRALKQHISCLKIFYGHFSYHDVFMKNAEPPPKIVKVIKTEEKGSDVNLSVQMLNDAWLDAYDCAVLISNDSDMAEALKLVKTHHSQKHIWLINPTKNQTSHRLQQYANQVRKIRSRLLVKCQLPQSIPKSSLCKPRQW